MDSLACSFNCASKGSKAPWPRTRSRHLGESPATFPNAQTAYSNKTLSNMRNENLHLLWVSNSIHMLPARAHHHWENQEAWRRLGPPHDQLRPLYYQKFQRQCLWVPKQLQTVNAKSLRTRFMQANKKETHILWSFQVNASIMLTWSCGKSSLIKNSTKRGTTPDCITSSIGGLRSETNFN